MRSIWPLSSTSELQRLDAALDLIELLVVVELVDLCFGGFLFPYHPQHFVRLHQQFINLFIFCSLTSSCCSLLCLLTSIPSFFFFFLVLHLWWGVRRILSSPFLRSFPFPYLLSSSLRNSSLFTGSSGLEVLDKAGGTKAPKN